MQHGIERFMSHLVCWLVEERIFYSSKISIFSWRRYLIYIAWRRRTRTLLLQPRIVVLYREKKVKKITSHRCAVMQILLYFQLAKASVFTNGERYIHPCADKIADHPGYNRFISRRHNVDRWDEVEKINRVWDCLFFFAKSIFT